MDSHQDESNNNSLSVGGGIVSKSSFLCRQSSSRWIPTGEQVRILRDLYYNCGVRSPSAEQIQKISARLRQYGMIEGKNVFYWFQNHKARERQKKRLTVDTPIPTSNSSTAKLPTTTMSPGVSGPCSPSLYGVEQMGSSGCDGSLLMERRFRESCISREGDGFEPTASPYAAAEQEASTSRKIETLPLFPVHCQDQEEQEDQEVACDSHHHHPTTTHHQPDDHFYWGGGNQQEQDGQHHLELSLSSCYYTPPGSM